MRFLGTDFENLIHMSGNVQNNRIVNGTAAHISTGATSSDGQTWVFAFMHANVFDYVLDVG